MNDKNSLKNWGITLTQNTGNCIITCWKVPANSSAEAKEKFLDFIKADEGFKEFYTAWTGSDFPYNINYPGFSDSYVENHCLEMTSENLKKEYQSYAKDIANIEYECYAEKDTTLIKYCEKYGIQYK